MDSEDEYWSEQEQATTDFQEHAILQSVSEYTSKLFCKKPCRTSPLSGEEYIQELVQTAYPRQCLEVLRMPLEILRKLELWLASYTSLRKSRKNMSITQKPAMLLQIVGEGASNRTVQERFQHSGETVSSVFLEILEVLLVLHKKTVHQPTKKEPLAVRIAEDTKYNPYFKDCLGALDGTHLPIHVLAIDCALFRNRKGYLSQNLRGVCTFDLKF